MMQINKPTTTTNLESASSLKSQYCKI